MSDSQAGTTVRGLEGFRCKQDSDPWFLRVGLCILFGPPVVYGIYNGVLALIPDFPARNLPRLMLLIAGSMIALTSLFAVQGYQTARHRLVAVVISCLALLVSWMIWGIAVTIGILMIDGLSFDDVH